MTALSQAVTTAEVSSALLEAWPLDAAQIISGDPQASGTLLWKSEDSTLAMGIWACTPGSFEWTHADEMAVVIEGRATVERESDDPVELAPGVAVFFPEGLTTRWTVHEHLRKAFHLHSSEPLPF
jgi:uncharacterized cupin superfamily protein